jgi:hypothetical protein
MVKQQRRFGIPHQIRYFAREFAVRNSDSRKIDTALKIDIHWTSPAELMF